MKYLLLFAFVLLFSSLAGGQSNKNELKDSLVKEWDKLDLFKKMAAKEVPGFSFYAALVWDGKIASAKKMGYANRETKLPLDENTIFMWGSISKMFTSVAVLQLVEKGKLGLNEAIVKYIPELGKGLQKYGGLEAIKVHHLLNHNSGISLEPCYDSLKKAFPEFNSRIPKTKDILPFLKFTTQSFTPGTKVRYSNGGYSLLGVLVERVSGKKFTKYVARHIFKPLGMKTAHYGVTPKKLSKRLTRAYYRMKNGKMDTMHFDVSQGFQEGNGGVKATIKDMLKFMDFLRFRKNKSYFKRYEKVLATEALKKYYFEVDTTNSNSNKFSASKPGKLWAVYRFSGFIRVNSKKVNASVTGHSGSIAFHISYFYFSNEQPFGIMAMINVTAANRTAKEAKMKSKLFRAIRDFSLIPRFEKSLYTR